MALLFLTNHSEAVNYLKYFGASTALRKSAFLFRNKSLFTYKKNHFFNLNFIFYADNEGED